MANTKYIISLVDRVSRTAKTIQGSLNKVTAQAEKTASAIDGIGLIAGGAAVAGIFKLGAELESTNLMFNTLTGSVEAGTKLFDDLTQFANSTPFSNQALNKNAQTLLAFGEDAENVVGTLRMLGDIAAGDQERLKSLTLAFAQMQSAGRLMGQDLLQMINAGFNPLQIISEQTGLSMAHLKDQMSKGAISADLVRKAFETATAKGGRFHNLTNDMAGTMAGKWSTVMGKAKFLIAEFGLSMKDVFTPFLDAIIKAIDFVSKYRNVIFPVLTVLATMTATIIGLVSAIKIWIGVQKIINILLTANPIGLIIVGVAALITAITILWQRSEGFRGVILGVWEVIKGLSMAIGDQVKKLKEFEWSWKNVGDAIQKFVIDRLKVLLEGIKGVGRTFQLLWEKQWKAAAAEAGKAFLNLQPTAVIFGGADKILNAGKKAGELYKEGFAKGETAKTIKNPFDMEGAGDSGTIGLDLSQEAKALQATGVVSGGIKTFNINISQITGVETLSSTTVQESATQVGDAVVLAITKALADIKNVG